MNHLVSIAVILALVMLHTTQASTTAAPGTGSGTGSGTESGMSSFSFKEAMFMLNGGGGETTPSPGDAGTFFVEPSPNGGSSNTVMTNVNLPSWPMPPTTQQPVTTIAPPTDATPSSNTGSSNSQWPSGTSSGAGASSSQWPSATGSGAGTSSQWPTAQSTTGGASSQWSGSDYLKHLINTMPRFTHEDIPHIMDRIRMTKDGLASIGLSLTHRDLGQVLKDYQAVKAASATNTATGSVPSTGTAGSSATDPAGIWSAFSNMVSTGQQQQPTASIPSSAIPSTGTSASSSGSPSILAMLQGLPGGTTGQTSTAGSGGSSLMDMMQKMQSGMTGQTSMSAARTSSPMDLMRQMQSGMMGQAPTAGAGGSSIMDMMQKMQSGMTGQTSTAGAGTPSVMDMMQQMKNGMMGQTPTAGAGGSSIMDMLQKMQGGMTGQTPTAGAYGTNSQSPLLGAKQSTNYVMAPTYDPSVSGILPTRGKGSIAGNPPQQQTQQQLFQNQLQNQLYKIQEQQKLINRLNTAGRTQTSSNPLAAYMQQGQQRSAATNPLTAMLQAQQQKAANPLAAYMQPKSQNAAATNPLAAFFNTGRQNAGQTTAANPLAAFMQQQQNTAQAGANPLAAYMQPNNMANPLAMMMQSGAKANPLAGGQGMNLNSMMNSVMPQMAQPRPMQSPLTAKRKSTGGTRRKTPSGDLFSILGGPNTKGPVPDTWLNSLLGPSSPRFQNQFRRPGMGGNSMFPPGPQPHGAMQALVPAMAYGAGMDGPWGAMAMAQAMNRNRGLQQNFVGLMQNPLFLMNMATGGEMFSM